MVRDAGEAFSRYVITYRGRPEAVVMGYEEFEGWLETMEIVSSPVWKRALAAAKREDKAGRRLGYESVIGKKQNLPRLR
ncbi:MAG: hypothetical protein A3J74_10360 [Elusimicrobia bacterium RIFCSPHIGHO2_02_FULL_57_9]|nr:MAG: hypothetical protein A3J74_10360 [Elusimicrobia bacterium RIFCSPHIGHO2_02_FULL_57_9]